MVAPGYQLVAQDAVALDTVVAGGSQLPKVLDGAVGHRGGGGNNLDRGQLVADAYGAGALVDYYTAGHHPPFVGVHIVPMWSRPY